jgi:hypothetical protein
MEVMQTGCFHMKCEFDSYLYHSQAGRGQMVEDYTLRHQSVTNTAVLKWDTLLANRLCSHSIRPENKWQYRGKNIKWIK